MKFHPFKISFLKWIFTKQAWQKDEGQNLVANLILLYIVKSMEMWSMSIVAT